MIFICKSIQRNIYFFSDKYRFKNVNIIILGELEDLKYESVILIEDIILEIKYLIKDIDRFLGYLLREKFKVTNTIK